MRFYGENMVNLSSILIFLVFFSFLSLSSSSLFRVIRSRVFFIPNTIHKTKFDLFEANNDCHKKKNYRQFCISNRCDKLYKRPCRALNSLTNAQGSYGTRFLCTVRQMATEAIFQYNIVLTETTGLHFCYRP